jgi:hypothetical protein
MVMKNMDGNKDNLKADEAFLSSVLEKDFKGINIKSEDPVAFGTRVGKSAKDERSRKAIDEKSKNSPIAAMISFMAKGEDLKTLRPDFSNWPAKSEMDFSEDLNPLDRLLDEYMELMSDMPIKVMRLVRGSGDEDTPLGAAVYAYCMGCIIVKNINNRALEYERNERLNEAFGIIKDALRDVETEVAGYKRDKAKKYGDSFKEAEGWFNRMYDAFMLAYKYAKQ